VIPPGSPVGRDRGEVCAAAGRPATLRLDGPFSVSARQSFSSYLPSW
jgi:hypothetical protein